MPTSSRRAAELGVTKINIDTDGRLVWTRVHREYFLEHPEEFDLRPIGQDLYGRVCQIHRR